MKRFLFLTGFLGFQFFTSHAQVQPALEDAMKLCGCIQDGQFITEGSVGGDDARGNCPTVVKGLERYILPDQMEAYSNNLVPATQLNAPSALNSAFSGNPILAGYIPDLTSSTFKGQSGKGTEIASLEVPSSISGLDVTTFADGLAQFLVDRTKEELTIAFFDRLQDAIAKSEALQDLFPNTSSLLSAMGTEIWEFKDYIKELREAFTEDLEDLPDGLETFIDETDRLVIKGIGEKCKKKDDTITIPPAAKAVALEVIRIGKWLSEGMHPGDVLDAIATGAKDTLRLNTVDPTKNLMNSTRLANLISQTLRTTSESASQYWIPYDSLRRMTVHGWRIYFGLLYQESLKMKPAITFQNGNKTIYFSTELDTLLKQWDQINENWTQLQELKALIEEFLRQGSILSAIRQDAVSSSGSGTETASGDSVETENAVRWAKISRFYDASFDWLGKAEDVISLAADWNLIPDSCVRRFKPVLDKIVFAGEAISEIAADVQQRQYSSAIANTIMFLDTCFNDSLDPILTQVLKYGSFFAAVAEADSAEEVKKAIESFAMPAGSSIVKKETRWNAAVQAYVGLNARKLIHPNDSSLTFWQGGIYAPVGLSFSKGFSLFNTRWSLSAFASLLDVGALVKYRFSSADSVLTGKVQLGDIFSPGVNIALGLPKIPVSIGAGWQAGPALTEIADDTPTISSDNLYSRMALNAFIAVDIPILNLYSNSRTIRLNDYRRGPGSSGMQVNLNPAPKTSGKNNSSSGGKGTK